MDLVLVSTELRACPVSRVVSLSACSASQVYFLLLLPSLLQSTSVLFIHPLLYQILLIFARCLIGSIHNK